MYYFNYKRYISQSISEPHRTKIRSLLCIVYTLCPYFILIDLLTLNNINIYDLYFVRRIYFLNNLHSYNIRVCSNLSINISTYTTIKVNTALSFIIEDYIIIL